MAPLTATSLFLKDTGESRKLPEAVSIRYLDVSLSKSVLARKTTCFVGWMKN